MKSIIVGMLAETFVHIGTGQNMGAIDLPVARESVTSYPYIAGSSLKGALRSAFERKTDTTPESTTKIFGSDSNSSDMSAGSVVVSDARLLLLPVRSLSGNYKWVTCPYVLERFNRDLQRSKLQSDHQQKTMPTISIAEQSVLCKKKNNNDTKLFLEERSFTIVDTPENAGTSKDFDDVVEIIAQHIPNKSVAARLSSQLAILHDDDFAWFAKYGLAITARNSLDEKKIVKKGALWYEEALSPDTFMYSLLVARHQGVAEQLDTIHEQIGNYLQVGGNETVGHGWFNLHWHINTQQEAEQQEGDNKHA